jgi:DnaJ-class molecular chaperone
MAPEDREDEWNPDVPPEAEEGECRSCLGYGYFRPNGEPTIDRRERKCLDCGGTGRAPSTTPETT